MEDMQIVWGKSTDFRLVSKGTVKEKLKRGV